MFFGETGLTISTAGLHYEKKWNDSLSPPLFCTDYNIKMSSEQIARTKFAFGHFLTAEPDDPNSFAELAKRFAPRLREVYFPWPGLSNARARGNRLRGVWGRTAGPARRRMQDRPVFPSDSALRQIWFWLSVLSSFRIWFPR